MQINILWADDEIDLLKPHILFLEDKGYAVTPVHSGREALDAIEENEPDIVFLDEQMPGLTGLDTLQRIKQQWPQLPVVMITKSEEENLMEDALGGKISDYLIKPVNPNQILLTVKKHTELRRLQNERSSMNYQQQFRELAVQVDEANGWREWVELYRKLVYWDMELASLDDSSLHEILASQRRDANRRFCRYFESKYRDWLCGGDDKPTLSPVLLRERLFPLLKEERPTFLIVIDNFRYDQWKYVQPTIEQHLRTVHDDLYFAIIPTTTQFARNAMFAGLMPSEIERKYPQYWVNEGEQGWKNQYESELLEENLRRNGFNIRYTYSKVLNAQYGKKLVDRVPDMMHNRLNVVVYNFIDMLSHARTESDIVRELAEDERAYRTITLSWLEHSPLFDLLKVLSERDVNVVITTDHGSVKIEHPVRVKGDREVSTNLRYKHGRWLDYNPRDVFEEKDPSRLFLPRLHVSAPYIFCHENDFFAYPNNYNQYVQYYNSTFQHGGISMEEVMIPYIVLRSKQ